MKPVHERRPAEDAVKTAAAEVAAREAQWKQAPRCDPTIRERGSAKGGRHSSIFVPARCICAVAARRFDSPHQKVFSRRRVPSSISRYSLTNPAWGSMAREGGATSIWFMLKSCTQMHGVDVSDCQASTAQSVSYSMSAIITVAPLTLGLT